MIARAFGILAAFAVGASVLSAQAPTETPPQPTLDTAVARTLRRGADAILPALVAVRIERYEPTRRSARGRRAALRRVRQLRGIRAHQAEIFDRYLERPRGPVTGLLVRPDTVLTSHYHVDGCIEGVWLEFADGSMARGRIGGWNATLDLAVIRFDPARTTAQPFALAPAPVPPVGASIAVIGAAWGRDRATINPGIVSAHDRLDGRAVQLSASLNAGNSGGAVIDLDGRVVAIVGHVDPINARGLNSGIGFATPVARVLEALDDLVAGRQVERDPTSFLGVRAEPAGKDRVLVTEIVPDSAAAAAGVQIGDRLLSVDGTRIFAREDLIRALQRRRAGDTVEVVVERGGEPLTLRATLRSRG